MDTKTAREQVFLLLYELELRRSSIISLDDFLRTFFETAEDGKTDSSAAPFEQAIAKEKAKKYISEMVKGIYRTNDSLNKTIEKYLRDWAIERISKLSLSGIKLAIYEMKHNEKITPAIAISEVVKLVMKYEGEEASSFVNGVLGQYVKASE